MPTAFLANGDAPAATRDGDELQNDPAPLSGSKRRAEEGLVLEENVTMAPSDCTNGNKKLYVETSCTAIDAPNGDACEASAAAAQAEPSSEHHDTAPGDLQLPISISSDAPVIVHEMTAVLDSRSDEIAPPAESTMKGVPEAENDTNPSVGSI